MTVELKHEPSGRKVLVAYAKLGQKCAVCQDDVWIGSPIATVLGLPDPGGWFHLSHLGMLLGVTAPPPPPDPVRPPVRNVVVYVGAGTSAPTGYRKELEAACAQADADGMALVHTTAAHHGLAVLRFVGTDDWC